MKVKRPDEIAKSRRSLERQLEELDDAEQAWAELSDEQRATEMFHDEFCKATKHYKFQNDESGFCPFDEENWSDDVHKTKTTFQIKVNGIIEAVAGGAITDEQLVKLFAAIKKAVA